MGHFGGVFDQKMDINTNFKLWDLKVPIHEKEEQPTKSGTAVFSIKKRDCLLGTAGGYGQL